MSGATIYFKSQSRFNEVKRKIAKIGWPSYFDEPIKVFESGQYKVYEEHVRLLTPYAIFTRMLYKRYNENIKRELLQRLEKQ